MPFEDLAAEMATGVRRLRAVLAERDVTPAPARTPISRSTPRDWPDLCRVSPTSAGRSWSVAMGNASRFPDASAFKRVTGLTPKASETDNTDRKGQAMSKAGPRRLRDQLGQSANRARRVDPLLAEMYFTQMVERGAHHQKALCVVAARLAERARVVLSRGEPYEVRDVDDTPVTREEAKAIIAERYQVPEYVRRRRRSGKSAGKAPHQVLEAHARSRTAQPRGQSRRPPPRLSTRARSTTPVKTTTTAVAIGP